MGTQFRDAPASLEPPTDAAMPRYVILQHNHPHGLHYDFMLETGGVLTTWSLKEPPAIGVEQNAELLPDHRLAYLDYEGPVSGDRGTVQQWDKGSFRLIEQTSESIIVELFGEKIRGPVKLAKDSETVGLWKMR